MADNIIKVNVTASKSQRVNVSSAQVGTEITASSDTGKFWAQNSKNWAVSENIVDNEDYSSKYYANKAKTSAENAKSYSNSTREEYEKFIEDAISYVNELNELKEVGELQINEAVADGKEEIERQKNSAIDVIENVADGEKEEIKDLADLIKENAQDIANRTSFSMFDTILKDHILTYEESKGLALQGTYVYKDAVAGSRYGYPDFYNKCLEEYQNSTNEQVYLKSNVTKVGAVVDNQGVLSGFSASNYGALPNTFNPQSYTWERVIKFTTSTVTGSQVIWGNDGDHKGCQFWITSSKFYLSCSSNNSSWNIGEKAGTYSVLPNTTYWVRINYTGTEYTLEYSTDGKNYVLDVSISSSTPVGVSTIWLGTHGSAPSLGSIDLNESYIDINGERWWSGIDNLEYKKNPNGHLFYGISQKDQIDELFNSTGTAWFYGIDKENERIFLPRNNYFEQATGDISEVGESVDAGLPNITGWTNGEETSAGGAFAHEASLTGGCNNGSHKYEKINFDASRSSSIYGNSDTVQPPSVKKLLYICVGNTEVASSVTDVVEVTTTENDTIPLFADMYFDFTPNNVSWLKAGEQANSGGIYTTCYNELVNVLNGETKYGNLKVVDTANMIAGIDYSEYWKVNQEDMTFITPKKTGERVLVEKKEPTDDDPTWYNLYSDGWCEQFGTANGGSSGSTINLLIPYSNTNYSIDTSGTIIQGGSFATGVNIENTGKTNNSFNYHTYNANGVGAYGEFYWRACGYTTIPTNTDLYFKVANAVQNLELLDAGEVLEILADKISRQDCKAYVTETYVNGTSWYRVYSDGWCEQGGQANVISKSGGYSVTLLKGYKDTDYSVLLTGAYGATATYIVGAFEKSETTFKIVNNITDGKQRLTTWEAKGYIA